MLPRRSGTRRLQPSTAGIVRVTLVAAVLSSSSFLTTPATASMQETVTLENIEWRLALLADGMEVKPQEGRDSPQVLLSPSQSRMMGYGGCNRFGGSYELNGTAVTFGPLTTTLMACASGMDIEQAFLEALAETRSWRVVDERLDFLDADGGVVASFEALE